MKKGYRASIRSFLRGVEWANPRNISILICGDPTQYNWADTELIEMTNAKREGLAIKRLISTRHIFATPSTNKKDKGDFNIEHDLKLRDVLAKFLYLRGHNGIHDVSVKRIRHNPDAHLGSLYFELDNGHENDSQLVEKLRRYSERGAYRVLFIMAHRYGDPDLESKRLKKLFELTKDVLYHKPNRILGATYHQYLEDGVVYNYRGDECRI